MLRAASYLTLSVAEFQTYIEQTAIELLNVIVSRLNAGEVPWGIHALTAAYSVKADLGMPSAIGEIKRKDYVGRIRDSCIFHASSRIDSNQSVKSHSLLTIFIPLGVDETKIDTDFLTDLNTVGSRRNDCAHSSLSFMRRLPDPKDDRDLVLRILGHFVEFEKLVGCAAAA